VALVVGTGGFVSFTLNPAMASNFPVRGSSKVTIHRIDNKENNES